jgi:triacylglycerol lipase
LTIVAPSNKCPILLVHGIARFDILQHTLIRFIPGLRSLLGDGFHYFKGIKSFLERNGFDVRHINLDFAGSIQKRSGELARQIHEVGQSKVHMIAHSMGGLDARHMIVNTAGMDGKIATLTTIGTPHHGTVFADRGLGAGGDQLIDALRPLIDLEGFEDLTTAACQKFNAQALEAEAANDVIYQAYSSAQQRDGVFPLLQASWDIIHETEGANDGLVSVKSQAWVPELVTPKTRKPITQKQFPFPADHLNEVGWWDPNERRIDRKSFEAKVSAVYLEIAENLLAVEQRSH